MKSPESGNQDVGAYEKTIESLLGALFLPRVGFINTSRPVKSSL
jgi:hypothetical protein